MKEHKENLTIRIPSWLRSELEERAENEGRTLSNLIVFLLKESMNEWDERNE